MKKLILYILFIAISFASISQSIFRYKTTFEVKNRMSLSNTFMFNHSKLINLVGTVNLVINYKLNRSFSLGVIGGLSNVTFNKKYTFYTTTGVETTYEYKLLFKKQTYGVQLNYYFDGNISPLGNSINLFYLMDNYKVDDYNVFHAYLQRKETDDFQTDEKIKYLVQYIGTELNYFALLSKKTPLYFKYGIGVAIPINYQIIDNTVNENSFERYSNLSTLYQDADFLQNFKFYRSLTINLGIGILIK